MVDVDHFEEVHLFELVGDVPDHDGGSALFAIEDPDKVDVVVAFLGKVNFGFLLLGDFQFLRRFLFPIFVLFLQALGLLQLKLEVG